MDANNYNARRQLIWNHPNIVRQLFWNDKFNFQELSIKGELPELAELFGRHIDASLICITRLKLSQSNLKTDPMCANGVLSYGFSKTHQASTDVSFQVVDVEGGERKHASSL